MKDLFAIILIGFASIIYAQKEADKDYAVITTKHGEIVIEFFDKVAPMHVESFKILANENYFNGTTFHRVIPNFVIQGTRARLFLDYMNGLQASRIFGGHQRSSELLRLQHRILTS